MVDGATFGDKSTGEAPADREVLVDRIQFAGREGTSAFGTLVSSSPKMREVHDLIEKMSHSSSPVLIMGETGTGKELVARSIHIGGPRRHGPFVPIDCTGLVPTLVESELFGYVRGAFTGALQSRKGLIESAAGGTLFLDEIGELPPDAQAKFLRVLEERQLRPVGATAVVQVNFRTVAATNRSLQEEVDSRRFRRDLFYRLNVVMIELPPLRDRRDDIVPLAKHFLDQSCGPESAKPQLSKEAVDLLVAYDWPGNVRELQNVIARGTALGCGPVFGAADLPRNIRSPSADSRSTPLPTTLAAKERQVIISAVQECNGDLRAASRLLQIGRTTLYRKLKLYSTESASGEGANLSEIRERLRGRRDHTPAYLERSQHGLGRVNQR